MNNIQIGKILRNNLKVVPKAYDMSGKDFNCDCHLEITDDAFLILGGGDIKLGEKIVEEYLKQTNGQL